MLDEMVQRNASKFANKVQHEMNNEKNYEGSGFRIPKVWKFLKRFSGTFHQA